jgi:hypothetical protein
VTRVGLDQFLKDHGVALPSILLIEPPLDLATRAIDRLKRTSFRYPQSVVDRLLEEDAQRGSGGNI